MGGTKRREPIMNGKPWWASKTLWVNLIGIVNMVVRARFGYTLKPEDEVLILGVVNAILRLATRQPIVWKTGS
jgi:hypothetical protein